MISQKSLKIIYVAVAVFIVGAVLVWQMPDKQIEPSVTPIAGPVTFEEISFPTPSPVALIEDLGVVWQKPVKLQCDTSIFNSNYPTCNNDNAEFFKVGTQGNKDLILLLIHGNKLEIRNRNSPAA